jgi:hypothetical protein
MAHSPAYYEKNNEQRKIKYRLDPEKGRAKSRKWRLNNRAAFLASARRSNLKNNYGITEDDYQRMLQEQHGHCFTCSRTAENEHHKRLFIDHNHATGALRRLLCSRCNSILGYCYENPDTLRALANYLEKLK